MKPTHPTVAGRHALAAFAKACLIPLVLSLAVAVAQQPPAPTKPAQPAQPNRARQPNRPQQPAQPKPLVIPDNVTYKPDVTYGKGGDTDLKLDLAIPKGDGPFPVVVCIHGGGWRGGNKAAYQTLILQLAQRGYVAATVGYRLVPTAIFPGQVEDVKCAVRYLRAHAKELKINPDKIGATGGSAGGHLSLMLGVTDADSKLEGTGGWADQSSRVQAVVNYFGPTELSAQYEPNIKPLLENFLGGTPEQVPNAYKRASPVTYLSKDDPPILTLHGTADKVVLFQQAQILDAACKKAGVRHELITMENAGHGFGGEQAALANKKLVEFFDKHLK